MGVRPLALFLASELLLQAVCLLASAALVGPSAILGLLPTSSVLGLSPLPSLGRLASLGVTPQIKHPSCLIRGWKPAARGPLSWGPLAFLDCTFGLDAVSPAEHPSE